MRREEQTIIWYPSFVFICIGKSGQCCILGMQVWIVKIGPVSKKLCVGAPALLSHILVKTMIKMFLMFRIYKWGSQNKSTLHPFVQHVCFRQMKTKWDGVHLVLLTFVPNKNFTHFVELLSEAVAHRPTMHLHLSCGPLHLSISIPSSFGCFVFCFANKKKPTFLKEAVILIVLG